MSWSWKSTPDPRSLHLPLPHVHLRLLCLLGQRLSCLPEAACKTQTWCVWVCPRHQRSLLVLSVNSRVLPDLASTYPIWTYWMNERKSVSLCLFQVYFGGWMLGVEHCVSILYYQILLLLPGHHFQEYVGNADQNTASICMKYFTYTLFFKKNLML